MKIEEELVNELGELVFTKEKNELKPSNTTTKFRPWTFRPT